MKSENHKNFDFAISDKLADDLKSLYEPGQSVPPQVDRAVMDRASREIQVRPRHRRLLHWHVYAAAAAAVLVVCLLVSDVLKTGSPEPVAVKMDVNADGTVDMLDAFKLARMMETETPDTRWDMNADGVVDRGDVDTIAHVAVRLKPEVL